MVQDLRKSWKWISLIILLFPITMSAQDKGFGKYAVYRDLDNNDYIDQVDLITKMERLQEQIMAQHQYDSILLENRGLASKKKTKDEFTILSESEILNRTYKKFVIVEGDSIETIISLKLILYFKHPSLGNGYMEIDMNRDYQNYFSLNWEKDKKRIKRLLNDF